MSIDSAWMELDSDATTQTDALSFLERSRSEPTDLGEQAMNSATRIGRFRVLDVIGQGGMGRVYAAYDPQLDRRVALKVLLEPESSRGRPRLVREAHALAKLSHPNVVAVHEVGLVGQQCFVAMEHVRGMTLRQWLEENPRAQRNMKPALELLLQAGRGLAAAHAAGIVHRDFTPRNVLIGADGRVRVADFGLARYARKAEFPVDSPPDAKSRSGVPTPDETLTRTGSVAGTLAYMAPEQLRGEAIDDKADQFAFCSVAWEMVFGTRPFDAKTPAERLALITEGEPHRGAGANVSNRVERLLLRGLRGDPSARHTSMEALLAQLEPEVAGGRTARRRVAIVMAGGMLGIGALAVSLVRSDDAASQVCTGAASHLAGVWDESHRMAVRDAILGSELSYAPGVWERTHTTLEQYANDWVNMHTEACEATAVRHEQSEPVMELRMGCLRRAQQDLEAVVFVLADADAQVVEVAHDLTGGLHPLSRCADVDALQADVEPPTVEQAQAVEAVRGILATVRAQTEAGRYEQADRDLARAEEQIGALDYEPVRIELDLEAGSLFDRRGKYEESESRYRQALDLASRRRDLEAMQAASSELLWVVGYRTENFEAGLTFQELALRLARPDTSQEARAHRSLGQVFASQGRHEEAERELVRALSLQQKLVGDGHPTLATLHNALGSLWRAQGQYEKSEREYVRAVTIWENGLGADHPSVASARNNLGRILDDQGRYREAEREYRRALKIREQALNPDHPYLASSHFSLGQVSRNQGRFEEAKREYRLALEIWKEALGSEHATLAYAHNNLGICFLEQGRYQEAEQAHHRALAIRVKALGENHPRVADSYNNLGVVGYHAGRFDEAELAYQRALAIGSEKLGPEHPDIADLHNNLAEVYHAQEEYDEAERSNRLALAIYEKSGMHDSPRAASTHTNLGILFHTLGQHGLAETELRRAVEILEREHGVDHPRVAVNLAHLALVHLAQKRHELAIETAKRALAIGTASQMQPKELGASRFALARALWNSKRDRPRARELARQALRDYDASQSSTVKKEAEKVTVWLTNHDPTFQRLAQLQTTP